MHIICTLCCSFVFITSFWLTFFFNTLKKTTVRLTRHQAIYKFLPVESGITVQVHSTDYAEYIWIFCFVSMLPQKRFQILNIYVAIGPVINFLKCFLIVKLLVALHALLEFFHDSIQCNFFFEQAGHFSFNSWSKLFIFWYFEIRSLRNFSPQILTIARHDYLKEICVPQCVRARRVKVLDNLETVWLSCLIDSILPEVPE